MTASVSPEVILIWCAIFIFCFYCVGLHLIRPMENKIGFALGLPVTVAIVFLIF